MISTTMISSRLTFLLLLFLVHTASLHAGIGHSKNDDLKLYDEEVLEEVRGLTNHYCYNIFPNKPATGDMVAFRLNGSSQNLEVAMVKRKSSPDKDAWATPGGTKEDCEKGLSFILREFTEETGVKINKESTIHDLFTRYDEPVYDLRSAPAHKEVSAQTVFITTEQELQAGDDAREARFIPLSEIYNGEHEIAFNHAIWIEEAVQEMSEANVEGMDENAKKQFLHYSQPFNKRKIQTIIESNEIRNANKAKVINVKRHFDGKELIEDKNGKKLWPSIEQFADLSRSITREECEIKSRSYHPSVIALGAFLLGMAVKVPFIQAGFF